MGITDSIAAFILERLREQNGAAELSRRDLAGFFNCVPSQVNYVLATRFTPEHGYVVESRRGGGGYIRVVRVSQDSGFMMQVINAIGDQVDPASAKAILTNLYEAEKITREQGMLILAAIGPAAFATVPRECQPALRADILKQCLLTLAIQQK